MYSFLCALLYLLWSLQRISQAGSSAPHTFFDIIADRHAVHMIEHARYSADRDSSCCCNFTLLHPSFGGFVISPALFHSAFSLQKNCIMFPKYSIVLHAKLVHIG